MSSPPAIAARAGTATDSDSAPESATATGAAAETDSAPDAATAAASASAPAAQAEAEAATDAEAANSYAPTGGGTVVTVAPRGDGWLLGDQQISYQATIYPTLQRVGPNCDAIGGLIPLDGTQTYTYTCGPFIEANPAGFAAVWASVSTSTRSLYMKTFGPHLCDAVD